MSLSKQSHYFPEVVQILDITPNSPKMSVGSGFFIKPVNDKESLLLTNAHVIKSSPIVKIRCAFAHHERFPVRVAAVCYNRDVALLHVDEKTTNKMKTYLKGYGMETIPYFKLGSMDMITSPKMKLIALGHPMGMESQQYGEGYCRGWFRHPQTGEECLTISDPINPGNSGGPLVADINGSYMVLGINSAKLAGANIEGEGLCKNIDYVKAVLGDMKLALKPVKTTVNIENNPQIKALLQALLQHGMKIPKPAAAGFKEDHSRWLVNNMTMFNMNWQNKAYGGTVSGVPRAFDTWINRHVMKSSTEYLEGGREMLRRVIQSSMDGTMDDFIAERKAIGSWKDYRTKECVDGPEHTETGGLKMSVNLPLQTKVIRSPIFGIHSHPLKHIDVEHYYNIPSGVINGGVLVNDVLDKSLFKLNNGMKGDIIYGIQHEKSPVMMLNYNGTFEKKQFGVARSLRGLLNLIPMGDTITLKVARRVPGEQAKLLDISFKVRSPAHSELPPIHEIPQFCSESSEMSKGCSILGMKMSPLRMNHVMQYKLMDFVIPKNRYKFKMIVTSVNPNSDAWGTINVGSVVEQINGKIAPDSFDEFIKEIQKIDKASGCWHLETSFMGNHSTFIKKL